MGDVVRLRPERRYVKVRSFAEAAQVIDDFLDEDPAETTWAEFEEHKRLMEREDGYGPHRDRRD